MTSEPPRFSMLLAAPVRAAVETSGRTQESIARTVGITPKHLSRVLNGRDGLSAELAERIAVACDHQIIVTAVPVDFLAPASTSPTEGDPR